MPSRRVSWANLGNDVTLQSDQGGLLTGQPNAEQSSVLMATLSCNCPACAAAAAGAGGNTPGAYGTTPTEHAYQYVAQAQAPLTNSEGNVAALMAGSKWTSFDAASAKTVITFSFADPLTSTFDYASNAYQATLSSFSAADRQLTRDLLARIEAVCNVKFVEVADNATECGVLRYGYSQEPNKMNFAGYTFFPSSGAIGGDVWIGADQSQAQWDFYRPDLILHETLHALGLKHPFSDGAVLSNAQDIISNTVMSYSTVAGSTSGYMSMYPGEPMTLDIAALQYLYGAAASNAGDTRYDLASADFQGGFHVVWDSGGVDTFAATGIAHGVTLNLNEGASSNIGVAVSANGSVNGAAVSTVYTSTLAIAAGAVIENATGSAFDDVLIGNAVANRLDGGAGNDQLDGGAGDDVLTGGTGTNVLTGGDGLDTAVFAGAKAGYTVSHNAQGVVVAGANSSDTISGVERLEFSDVHVALDLSGNAGTAAKILGAVFGATSLHNAGCVGVVLNMLDGGMSEQAMVQAALNFRLGANAGNDAVVNLLYTNLVGVAPTAAQQATFVSLLDQGALTQAAFGQVVAETGLNAVRIDLVGLSNSGIEYIG
jgi:serralysin